MELLPRPALSRPLSLKLFPFPSGEAFKKYIRCDSACKIYNRPWKLFPQMGDILPHLGGRSPQPE